MAERGGGLELAIQGSRPPAYSVFKLQDPPRLVVDLAGADVSSLASPVKVGKGGVLSVSAAQYKDERSTVGRVIVALDGARRYEVAPRGDAVIVRVLEAEPAAAAASAAPAAPAAAVAPASPARPAGDDHVVAHRVDEAPARSPARAVTGVRPSADRLVLATDGDVARIDVIELRDPPRLVLDLFGVTRAPRAPISGAGAFSQVRFGRDAGKVRVVLDAAGALPPYQVARVRGGVAVLTGSEAAARAPATPAPAAKPAALAAAAPKRDAAPKREPAPTRAPDHAVAAAPTPPAAPARARISNVRFDGSGGAARIDIGGKAPFVISRADERTLVLTMDGAELPRALERSLDTSAFQGPVLMVSSFNQPATGQVRIVATLRGPAVDRIVETPEGLAWTVSEGEAPRAEARAEVKEEIRTTDAQAAGFAAEAPGYALSGAPQARGYSGRRITLEFHDIEVRNLLRLIADVSKKNIVVADDVTGKVTVSLRNVPWDQALDLVLRSKGLGKEEMGNVIRIARYEDIAKEQQARAEAEKARLPLAALKVRLIPVNFARAGEVATRVKDVLSERGSVSTDERTNVLIVKDVQDALVRAEGLVRNLDTETPQVLIESRIVEASSNFNRALGVQWGGNATFSEATGNATGANFPRNVGVAGGIPDGSSAGTATPPQYAVSLPAPVGDGQGGAIGLTLGSIAGRFNLNLRLSALENNGVVKTISAPKIATIDNKEATIGQGISIPFSQVSASGVNTTFVEAKLELKVTPHVTSDGSILLKIKATNNQPNPQLTGANGQPSISKREAETEVLVKDGETTVIGGIYTRQTASRRSEVPWISKIPLLGWFFRNSSEQDDHTELLIFITPRILNRQAAMGGAGIASRPPIRQVRRRRACSRA